MKNVILYIATVLLFSGLHVAAQPPIQWQKCYGGTGLENGRKVLHTADGGYIACGYTTSIDGDVTETNGYNDYWVIKVAANDTLQWQHSYGGSGSDLAITMGQLTDGSYVIAGYSDSNDSDVTGNHGGFDYWVLDISPTGNIVWQKSLGGSNNDLATALWPTNDGGVVVGGNTKSNDGDITGYFDSSDCWLVKLSSTGALMWQRTFGGNLGDGITSVAQTADNGYIVGASSKSTNHDVTGNHGDYDAWIVKLDADGVMQWQKSLGGSAMDVSNDIRQVEDGGYIMVGSVMSTDGDVTGNHGLTDYWVVKLSDTGAIEWQKCYGGTDYDFAAAVYPALGGGYLVGGRTYSADGDITGFRGQSDGWVIRIDDTGALLWQRSLGGTDYDDCSSLVQTADSGIVVVGYASSDDSDVSGNYGGMDVWMVRLAYSPLSTPQVPAPAGNKSLVLYPNPAKDLLHIISATAPQQIVIRDITGRLVYSRHTKGGSKDIDISALHPGIYFLQADDAQPQQFVKQ